MPKKSKIITKIRIDNKNRMVYLIIPCENMFIFNKLSDNLSKISSKFGFGIGIDSQSSDDDNPKNLLVQFVFRLNEDGEFDKPNNFKEFLKELKKIYEETLKTQKKRDKDFKKVSDFIKKEVGKLFDINEILV